MSLTHGNLALVEDLDLKYPRDNQPNFNSYQGCETFGDPIGLVSGWRNEGSMIPALTTGNYVAIGTVVSNEYDQTWKAPDFAHGIARGRVFDCFNVVEAKLGSIGAEDWGSCLNPITPSGSYYYTPHHVVPAALLSVAGVPVVSSLFSKLISELSEFENLGQNWDASGAHPIDARNIKAGRSLLADIATMLSPIWPVIGPMPDGSISFTWEIHNKELWVYALNGTFKSHAWGGPDEITSRVQEFTDAKKIRELLAWLKV